MSVNAVIKLLDLIVDVCSTMIPHFLETTSHQLVHLSLLLQRKRSSWKPSTHWNGVIGVIRYFWA